jgi:hypothetical protein
LYRLFIVTFLTQTNREWFHTQSRFLLSYSLRIHIGIKIVCF